jgi:hypothetical protein
VGSSSQDGTTNDYVIGNGYFSIYQAALINAREYRRGNQKWTIQKNWQNRAKTDWLVIWVRQLDRYINQQNVVSVN